MRRTSKLLKQFSQKQSTALFTNVHKIQAVPIMTVSKNHYSVAMPVKKATKQAQFVVQKKSYATKNIVVPPLADSITEGNIQAWLKNAGDQVAEDDVVCQLETAKVGVDVRAPASGTIKQLFAKTGDKVIVGQNLFELEEGAAPVKKEEKPVAAATQQAAPAAAPVAAPKKEEKKPAPAPVAPPQPAVNTGARTERRVQMSQMRQTIAQRLKDSQNTYALLTTFNEIDMSRLMDMRNRLKDSFQEKHKIKMGFMSAFVKAASVALQEQPVVNAVIDGTDIVYRDYVDVSVAVASPTGLVVPVLRNVESMSFADIEKSIAYYSEKAKTRTMTMQDMQGGTFTISNGGVFGSLMGTPIVNPPQSAILGMHATNKRAVVVNDQIVIRPMMYVALTYDHRIIDGKEAVTFLRRIKTLVEDPEQFLTA